MQLVVPIAVNAADAAAMMILSRISPHDVFFILLHSLICQFVHRDTKTQSPLCFFTADYADFTDFLFIGAGCGAAIICIICGICG